MGQLSSNSKKYNDFEIDNDNVRDERLVMMGSNAILLLNLLARK